MLSILDFDNSESKIMSRLLDMYPVEVLKQEFDASGYASDVIEQIVKQSPVKDLKLDALRLMGHCRQHVFVFAHRLNRLPSSFFSEHVVHEEIVKDEPNGKEVEYLLRATYNFVEIKGESAIPHRTFTWWPVKVVADEKFIQLRITIAERHTKSSGNFLFRHRNLDEEGIVRMLHGALGPKADLSPVDLNRGLKALWDKDVIDSKYVTRKTAKSLETSVMDEGYTFKKDDPKRYSELLADPLRKSAFTVLGDPNPALAETFAIDAGEGFIAFRTFTKAPDGIDNLISLILAAN